MFDATSDEFPAIVDFMGTTNEEFPVMVEFMGAAYAEEDGEKVYRALNAVSVNPFNVSAFYDHTILLGGNKIRVMETYDEIKQKLKGGQTDVLQ